MKLEKFKEAEEIKDRILQLQIFRDWFDNVKFKPFVLEMNVNSMNQVYYNSLLFLPFSEPCTQSEKLNDADLKCILNAIDQQIEKLKQEFEAL